LEWFTKEIKENGGRFAIKILRVVDEDGCELQAAYLL
jgi:hypothetical protein